MSAIPTSVSVISNDFDDYVPSRREMYEGTHMFVGVHVPIEHAKSLRLGTSVLLTFSDVTA